MKITVRTLVIALTLALLAGLSVSTPTSADDGDQPESVVVIKQFRSSARYDGNVIEYADDYFVGGKINYSAPTIYIGDEYTKKLWVGILDFDTSTLEDHASVIGAFLELRVLRYSTVFGDPYLLLGDIYVDMAVPYFGSSVALEAQDFEAFPTAFAGILPPAGQSNQKLTLEVDSTVAWMISPAQHTQFKLYFLDDNDDRYSQGIAIASGNHSMVSYRPLLTVYFYYP
ncbi:MAG: hypothetical protein AB1750_04460 [Chloroflexota bacterium]